MKDISETLSITHYSEHEVLAGLDTSKHKDSDFIMSVQSWGPQSVLTRGV